ncbi:MAG: UDP-N-acetylmuramoyl-tripeptide--D-alanyl-D-alanine ligase, partial [Bacteroidia bacterium]|nr:UDP-N-acetylmuramoyl-tripeptide--D-alanyl-D-alanine ligase [Bacteroidia bacterium]
MKTLYNCFLQSTGVCTDTRKIRPGELFFALRGPNFNGNLFAEKALEAGASWVVVDEPAILNGHPKRIVVENCLQTLQELANYHRKVLNVTVLGLTGSNGKTTTKELIIHVLRQFRPAFATIGNLNNHIGVPLSLLQIKPEQDIAILEMGDNRPGDIHQLAQIADPQFGLITNIGEDHLEFYETIQQNAATKLELFDYLHDKNQLSPNRSIFLNIADPWLTPQIQRFPNAYTYGTPNAAVRGKIINRTINGMEIEMTAFNQVFRLKTPLYGDYNLPNIEAAVAVSLVFGGDIAAIQEGIATYEPTNFRSQRLTIGNQTILLDAYNANPTSVEAAIRNLKHYNPATCAVILGDMLELGDYAVEAHTRIGMLISELKPAIFIGVGELMKTAVDVCSSKAVWYSTVTQLKPDWQKLTESCSIVLLKG